MRFREYNSDVVEAVLAHQDKNATRRTYNRSTYWDQRVKLMQEWADLCDEFRNAWASMVKPSYFSESGTLREKRPKLRW